MLLKNIKLHFDLKATQKDFRRLAVNLMTAGIVGVYINHYVGTSFSTMFWASVSIIALATILSIAGLLRRKKS
jgi:hypothetical protein